ncbi:MAG: hypothetical protein LBU06_02285 [Desulfovibrio sp.]|jgi:lipopolysaccharide biosynthesis glycosyltransferase|nr:hypothetical protein [Desulfovibrio sp.]
MLHLCFCFSDARDAGYYIHTLVALASVFANTSSSVCAHLLVDDSVPSGQREAFHALAERYGQQVIFYDMEKIDRLACGNVPEAYGTASLYRFFIHTRIDAPKVLYIDCDIIALLDVAEIFHWDTGEALFGAVLDSGLVNDKQRAAYLAQKHIVPGCYVNSGILLMQSRRIREEFPDFAETGLEMVRSQRFRYPDQDAINKIIQQRGPATLSLMPERFNYLVGHSDRSYQSHAGYMGKLLHYTRTKPWKVLTPAGLYYWKHRAQLTSIEETFSSMFTLEPHEHEYLFTYLLRTEAMRRWVNRVYDVSRQGFAEMILDRLLPERRKRKKRGL